MMPLKRMINTLTGFYYAMMPLKRMINTLTGFYHLSLLTVARAKVPWCSPMYVYRI